MFAVGRLGGAVRASLVLLVALAALSLMASAAQESATPAPASHAPAMTAETALAAVASSDGVLRFDVAENALMLAIDPDLAHDDGMPAYGASFITRGYIYPAGTLTADNGVNPDGSPEFPDQVLGIWICRGWMVGDGMATTTGVWVESTQLYDFGDAAGAAMLVSDGHELVDTGPTIVRAVTGGTGPLLGAYGEARQALLGFNAVEGVNLQFEIEYALPAS